MWYFVGTYPTYQMVIGKVLSLEYTKPFVQLRKHAHSQVVSYMIEVRIQIIDKLVHNELFCHQ